MIRREEAEEEKRRQTEGMLKNDVEDGVFEGNIHREMVEEKA